METTALTISNQFDNLANAVDISNQRGPKERPAISTAPANSPKKTKPNSNNNSSPSKDNTSLKPSPITVSHHNNMKLKTLHNDTGVNYQLRIISVGVRIFIVDINGQQHVLEALKDKTMSDYTHPMKTTSKLKVILRGLPQGLTDDILSDLMNLNKITIIDVRKIPTETTSTALYGVDFDRSVESLDKLSKEIRVIYHHRVSWTASLRRNSGPIVYSNCAMIGHGGKSCHRETVYTFCACAHNTLDCRLTRGPNSSKDVEHTPRYINCFTRNLRNGQSVANAAKLA